MNPGLAEPLYLAFIVADFCPSGVSGTFHLGALSYPKEAVHADPQAAPFQVLSLSFVTIYYVLP